MHPCDRERLMEFFDGELPEPDAARVELHVAGCVDDDITRAGADRLELVADGRCCRRIRSGS